MISRLRIAAPFFLLLSTAAFAEDPKPEAVIDKFVEVTGGRAAYDKVKNEMATGTLEVMGMSGALTTYREAPGKSYTLVDFSAGPGKFEEGTDGKVAWANDPMQGARVKDGDERATALRNASTSVEAHWRDYYKKVELAGSEDVDGKAAYKVVLTPNEGSAETRYYDKQSSLLVKVIMPITTPDGSVTAEVDLGDYRDEGGILTAHAMTQKLPNAELVIKIQSVKHNVDVPAGRFDLPAEIKAIVDKKPADKK